MELYRSHMHGHLLSREVEENKLRFYAYNKHTEGKNEAHNLQLMDLHNPGNPNLSCVVDVQMLYPI
jgi:hypothetical protein